MPRAASGGGQSVLGWGESGKIVQCNYLGFLKIIEQVIKREEEDVHSANLEFSF